MDPKDFPILAASARNQASFLNALASVIDGVELGEIRNAVLNDAKHVLNQAAYAAFDRYVGDRFFHKGKGDEQPREVQEFRYSLMVLGLHDVISLSKKLEKSQLTGPAMQAMREFSAEVLPLSLAVADLKTKAIKGRAPSTGPSKPENPDKIVKTCGCCFRGVAVQSGHMAHHGYERPGTGWQTNSCPGIEYPPLEVSSAGLEHVISVYTARRESLAKAMANKDNLTKLTVLRGGFRTTEFKKGDPGWEREFRLYVAQTESDLASVERTLPELQEMLRNWAPEPAPADPVVRRRLGYCL